MKNVLKTIALLFLVAAVAGGITYFTVKKEPEIEIIKDKSYFNDFEIVDGVTCIKCTITIRNNSDEDKIIGVSAKFDEDYESGLVSEEFIAGKWQPSGEEQLTVPANFTYENYEIYFYSQNNGCETKESRLLPELSILEY